MSARPRVGVIVLDFGRPADAERAALSARDPDVGADVLVVIVENGSGAAEVSPGRLRLPENRGFAGGMNAGIRHLLSQGCERVLLLNNDAVLEPGCLRLLSGALQDARLAAVGPVILRDGDGCVESRGLRVDLRSGRVRLEGRGEAPGDGGGLLSAEALSGAVLMLSRAAIERVGLLDEAYFFGFEDVDWCLRARRAGLGLAVVSGARARHVGGQTFGRHSPRPLYYAARNHVRLVEKLLPLPGIRGGLRRCVIFGLNLALALRQGHVPRPAAVRAVWEGFQDGRLGRFGSLKEAGRGE